MPTTQDSNDQQEQELKHGYKVRQVTHFQPSWREKTRGEAGSFFIQLILDHGVADYILEPEAEDTDVLVKLLSQGGYIGFDTERKILMFPNTATK